MLAATASRLSLGFEAYLFGFAAIFFLIGFALVGIVPPKKLD